MSSNIKHAALAALLVLVLLANLAGFVPAQANAAVSAPAQPTVDAALEAQLKGGGEVSYWIMFRQAPDLGKAAGIGDWDAQGQLVYDTLRANAEKSQAEVRKYLDAAGIAYTSYWINNSILVEGSSSKAVDDLKGFEEIESLQARKKLGLIEPVASVPADDSAKGVEPNISHVNADDAWAMGITGAGMVVANIDTGVRYTHTALNAQYRGNLGGGSYDNNYNWFDPYSEYTVPTDLNGHGSHTMGIMLGSDGGSNQTGMAPGAKWMACRGCSTSDCTDQALLTCAQFVLAPTDLTGANPDTSKRPNVVNNSWGDCNTSYDSWYRGAVDAWVAAGIYPVFSVGNASNCGYSAPPGLNTVGNPGRYGNVTGVGSTGQADGVYATHSNWGPTDNLDTINPRGGFPEMKPQVLAPGTSIRSTGNSNDTAYLTLGGTSMSAPHVAGLVALIWQAAPCLVGDYALTESLIEETATDMTYNDGSPATPTNFPNYATGWGEIDALAAVQQAAVTCSGSSLHGTVTDAGSLAPLSGVSVHITGGAVNRTLTTLADGSYNTPILSGTYTIAVSLYGYGSASVSGVYVGDGASVEQNFALSSLPPVTISGQARDASGHTYPLPAKIAISTPGFYREVYTGLFDGSYTTELLHDMIYHFEITSIVPGYSTLKQDINVGDGGIVNFDLQVDPATCGAPGYEMVNGMGNNLDSLTPPALPSGWSSVVVTGTDVDNYWSTYQGTWHPAVAAYSLPNVLLYRSYSINTGNSARLVMGDYPISTGEYFSFKMYHDSGFPSSNDRIQVQVSLNGTDWTPVGAEFSRYSATAGWSDHAVDLSAYSGQTVKLAILGTSAYGNDIHLDNIQLGNPVCGLQSGGLLGGHVTDANTGIGLDGAQVSGGNRTTQSFTAAGSPYGAGLYFTFASGGSHTFTAETTGYASDSQDISIGVNALTAADFALGAPYLVPAATQVVATVPYGTTANLNLQLNNTGSVAGEYSIFENSWNGAKDVDVLVVAKDASSAATMEAALTALGYTYTEVSDTTFQSMTVADLLQRPAVFYAGTPADTSGGASELKLVAFLTAGGDLLISGSDIGYYLKSTVLYTTYLQSTYVADNGGDFLVGEDMMSGITSLDISGDPYPDSFDVGAEGTRIFRYSTGTHAGGAYIERAGYRAIYLSFDYKYIATTEQRNQVMQVVMDKIGGTDIPWLSESPISGTIPAHGSVQLQLTFDATSYTNPDTAYARLLISTQTLYGRLSVPVTMQVVSPADLGQFTGTVTAGLACDLPGDPLEGALVQAWTRDTIPSLVNSSLTTAGGAYSFSAPAGTYDLRISKDGYKTEWLRGVVLPSGGALNQDIFLRLAAPCLVFSPPGLSIDLLPGGTGFRLITITNTGAQGVLFHAYAVQDGAPIERIIDGGFELGTTTSPWTGASVQFGTPLCDNTTCGTNHARSGSWWVWFGGSSAGDTASVYQMQPIPPGAATLSFYVQNYDCGSGGAANFMRLTIDGTELWRTDGLDSTCGVQTYRQVEVDISALANGASHTVMFEGVTTGQGSFFLDDVSLLAEPVVAWSGLDTTTGLLPADGGKQTILVNFNAMSLVQGTYHAFLELRTTNSDKAQNSIQGSAKVPLSMTVTDTIKFFLPMIVR